MRGHVGLLLDSDRPLTWRLAGGAAPPSSSSTILVGHSSSPVLDAQGAPLPSRAVGPADTPEARMKLATQAFQHVTTFTIVKSANKIVINLPQGKIFNFSRVDLANFDFKHPLL